MQRADELMKKARKLLPRKIEPKLLSSLKEREILVLVGSRQVGKTSLLFRSIAHLLSAGFPKSQIAYLDLEFPPLLSDVNQLYGEDFLSYLHETQDLDSKKPSYVFIDEIHYLDNPASFLKTMHDHFPQVKLVVSGSSSLEIKKKFKESLAGRKKVFEIHSLDFDEFLLFKGFSTPQIKADLSLLSHLSRPAISVSSGIKYHSKKLLSFFEEFVLFGGYPAVVLKTKKEDKINLLYELYSTYVRRDIKDFRAIENIAGFNRLVELLAHQIGNIINLSELCNSANLSRPTIEDYLFLLQNTFIATLLNPFFTNARQEIVKSPKIYFNDCGLRNAVLRNFLPLKNRTDRGALFENAVFTELSKKLPPDYELRFWRTKSKAEVDFILKGRNLIPIEVKSAYSQVPSGLRSFMESHLSPYGIILNDTLLKKQRKAKNITVYFYPFWLI